MNSRDVRLAALVCGIVTLLLAPALLLPGTVLENFGDIYLYHYPLRHLAASEIQSGRVPFWNPYIFAGVPLAANPQSSLFYPVSLVFDLFPIGWGFTFYCWFHLAFGAVGMHLWARSRGAASSLAACLAAAFCLGPYLIYRIPQGIPTHLSGLSLVPWCWLALQSGRRGFLAGVWSLQVFSGHPQFGAINAAAMGLYALVRRDGTGRTFLREGLGAAALSVLPIFLAAEFLGASNRLGLPESFANAYSMPPHAAATLLWPGLFGTPLSGSFRGLPSVFFEEYASYIGVVPLLAAAAALFYARTPDGEPGGLPGARFGWGLALLGFTLALGRYSPVRALTDSLPGLGMSRVPARFSFLMVWGLLIAAAAGGAALTRAKRPGPRVKAAVFALIVADLGLWSALWLRPRSLSLYLAPRPELVEKLAGRPVRFASLPGETAPNKAMLYRAMNVNGYEAFYLKRYAVYASRSEGRPAADPSRTHIARADSPGMSRLGVAHAMTRRPDGTIALDAIPEPLPLAYLADGGRLAPARVEFRHDALWRAGGVLPESTKDPSLVLAVPKYPGWRAWLNGEPAAIGLRDGLVQSISLAGLTPGAPFSADFRFRPTAWTALCLAGAAAWAAWLAVFKRSLGA